MERLHKGGARTWATAWLGLFITSIFLLTVTLPVYGAESVQTAENRMKGAQKELDRVAEAYSRAYSEYCTAANAEKELTAKLSRTEAQLHEYQGAFERRAKLAYEGEEQIALEIVFGARSLSELIADLEYLHRVVTADSARYREARTLFEQYRREKSELDVIRDELNRKVNVLRSKRTALSAQLKKATATYEAAKRAKTSVVRASRSSGTYSSRGYRVGSFVFPVSGPHSYSNSFGAPRSGGRRHKGTDIMAPHGTPVVACVSGTVTLKSSSLGGLTIWLRGVDGNSYYYAHLSGYAVSSGASVSAGQVIGYVGSSGNASDGAPHLHFEIKLNGTSTINPYYTLRASG